MMSGSFLSNEFECDRAVIGERRVKRQAARGAFGRERAPAARRRPGRAAPSRISGLVRNRVRFQIMREVDQESCVWCSRPGEGICAARANRLRSLSIRCQCLRPRQIRRHCAPTSRRCRTRYRPRSSTADVRSVPPALNNFGIARAEVMAFAHCQSSGEAAHARRLHSGGRKPVRGVGPRRQFFCCCKRGTAEFRARLRGSMITLRNPPQSCRVITGRNQEAALPIVCVSAPPCPCATTGKAGSDRESSLPCHNPRNAMR